MKYSMNIAPVVIFLITSFVAGAQNTGAAKDGVYGDGIRNERYMDFNTLVAEMAKKDTVQTTLIATVDQVCQAKGCWMTLHGEKADSEQIMVRFKDYGFFVPKDIGGRKVIVEGKAYTSVIPVEELRHYAEDAGKSKEEIMKITEPESTLSFEATGVRVLEKS